MTDKTGPAACPGDDRDRQVQVEPLGQELKLTKVKDDLRRRESVILATSPFTKVS